MRALNRSAALRRELLAADRIPYVAQPGATLFFARTRQLIGFNFCRASSRLPATRRTKFLAPRSTAVKE
jgi:hypothetical protein